jgi:hypothetical protein
MRQEEATHVEIEWVRTGDASRQVDIRDDRFNARVHGLSPSACNQQAAPMNEPRSAYKVSAERVAVSQGSIAELTDRFPFAP